LNCKAEFGIKKILGLNTSFGSLAYEGFCEKRFWRKFGVEEILKRDKTNLDIFWIKDKSLADLDNLPDPDILSADIIENLQSAMDSFNELMTTIEKRIYRPSVLVDGRAVSCINEKLFYFWHGFC
jgi:hypothetical protein